MLLWVMCKSGMKEFKFFTVNSPVHAVAKNVVVRQAKMVASRGLVSNRREQILIMVSIVYGSRGGHFEEVGARVFADRKSTRLNSSHVD